MPDKKKFTITVSSRALFNLEDSHEIYTKDGIDAYIDFQLQNENKYLEPGPAFPLVKKLLNLKDILSKNEDLPEIDIVLISRNSAQTSLRIFNSVEYHKLNILKAIFTNGEPTSPYVKALETNLFLSLNPVQVSKVIEMGIPAATISPNQNKNSNIKSNIIKIAFDGDSVLFSDDSEAINKKQGLSAFIEFERNNSNNPLNPGPFYSFLSHIHEIQKAFKNEDCPIRTALVTARGIDTHRRAINTLRHWDIRVDEAMFLDGYRKGPVLKAFNADIFFDDSKNNIKSATDFNIISGHVPYGARNEQESEVGFTGSQSSLNYESLELGPNLESNKDNLQKLTKKIKP